MQLHERNAENMSMNAIRKNVEWNGKRKPCAWETLGVARYMSRPDLVTPAVFGSDPASDVVTGE